MITFVGQCEKDRGTVILEKISGTVLRSASETAYDTEPTIVGITEVI